MQFLRQVLIQDETHAASTQRTDDLPVNPLSFITLTAKFLNNTLTITNYSDLAALLGFITKVEVLFQGSAVISGSLSDLARLAAIVTGRGPRQLEMTATDNNIRGVTVLIPLGRKLWSAKECFPAVRRGELRLQITSGAATTGVDNCVLQVETTELLAATPTHYLKSTTISKTPSATGEHEVDLPIGNKLAGVLMYGTTVPTGASFNASIGQARLLVDNVEAYYANTNWESLNGDLQARAQGNGQSNSHQHTENVAAAYAQYAQTDEQQVSADLFKQYAYMDLDPCQDDVYLLDTKGRARVHMKITADVADAIRVLPVEVVEIVG